MVFAALGGGRSTGLGWSMRRGLRLRLGVGGADQPRCGNRTAAGQQRAFQKPPAIGGDRRTHCLLTAGHRPIAFFRHRVPPSHPDRPGSRIDASAANYVPNGCSSTISDR